MSSFKRHASGLYLPEDYRSYPIAMDFFSGAGGFSLGFIKAGFQVIAGFEIDPYAAHTYMVNLGAYPIQIHYTSDKYRKILHDHFENIYKKKEREFEKNGSKVFEMHSGWVTSQEVLLLGCEISGSGWIKAQRNNGEYYPPVTNFFFGDVREIDGAWILDKLGLERGDLDAVIGGPPCQGYSRANSKRSIMDPRNSLVFEYARLVCELHPKTFVMEEVPEILNMVTPHGSSVVDELCMIYKRGGYGDYESLKKGLFYSNKNAKTRTQKLSEAEYEEEPEEKQLALF